MERKCDKIRPSGDRIAAMRIFGLLFIGLSLTLAGCTKNLDGREYIQTNGETTVVINQVGSILPKEGAAISKKTIANYRAFDFADDQTLIGYKFPEKVFADDRGIWYFDLGKMEATRKLPFDKSVNFASLSREKSQLAIIQEESGATRTVTVMDLATEVSKVLEVSSGSLWNFNWQSGAEGLSGYDKDRQTVEVLRLSSDGKLRKYAIRHDDATFLDMANLQSTQADLYYGAIGKNGGIYRFDWKTQQSQLLSKVENITKMILSPQEDRFALVNYEQGASKSALSIYGLDGKKHYEVYQAMNIDQLEWEPKGDGIAFTAIDESGVQNLFHADLTTGQIHFLGEYPSYSIQRLAYNSDGSKLLVTYFSAAESNPIWMTHILTLEQGGTNHEN